MNTEVYKFMDLVAKNFDSIKETVIKKCKSHEIEFNEDLFMDTILCCERVFGDKLISLNDCMKYFWVAYYNKIKTYKSKQNIFVSYDDIINYNIQQPIIDSYNPLIDSEYNSIVKIAYDKFDKEYVDAWLIHICEGKTYKELREMGYDFKFNDIFKRITKYIKKEYK